MAGTEQTYNTNTGLVDTRETKDAGDVAAAVAARKLDPNAVVASHGEGAPKREDYKDKGLEGDRAYSKDLRRWQRLQSDGQSKALGDMKND